MVDLQRIVNRGGRIEREYALGRKRTDLLVTWSHPGGVQKVVLELKILYGPLETALEKGLRQTWEYMDQCADIITNEVFSQIKLCLYFCP